MAPLAFLAAPLIGAGASMAGGYLADHLFKGGDDNYTAKEAAVDAGLGLLPGAGLLRGGRFAKKAAMPGMGMLWSSADKLPKFLVGNVTPKSTHALASIPAAGAFGSLLGSLLGNQPDPVAEVKPLLSNLEGSGIGNFLKGFLGQQQQQPDNPFGSIMSNVDSMFNVDPFEAYLQNQRLKDIASGQIASMNAEIANQIDNRKALAKDQRVTENNMQRDYDRASKNIQLQAKQQDANLKKQLKVEQSRAQSDLDQVMRNAQLAVAGDNTAAVAEDAASTKARMIADNAAANQLMNDIDRSGANAIASTRASGAKRANERKREVNAAMAADVSAYQQKMAENMRMLPQLMMQFADTAMGRDLQRAQARTQLAGGLIDYMGQVAKAQANSGMGGMDMGELLRWASSPSGRSIEIPGKGNEPPQKISLRNYDVLDGQGANRETVNMLQPFMGAQYRDFSAINKATGNEPGFFSKIASWL